MADQKYCVRITRKNNSANALIYRERASAEGAIDEIQKGMETAKTEPNGHGAVVRVKDDFGYDMLLDCGEIAAAWAVGIYDINAQQNEFEIAQRKGAMRLNALIEADAQLLAFLRAMAGQGQIIRPGNANGAG